MEASQALLCRLCTSKIKDNPIEISSKSSCSKVDIIRQHYGIQVIGSVHGETFICPNCWTTTEQFHQLYIIVQENESTLTQRTPGIAATTSPAVIKSEHANKASSPSPTQPPIVNPFENSSLLECKVEINDVAKAYDLFEDSMAGGMSPNSSSSSSSSVSRDASPVIKRKRGRPPGSKKTTPAKRPAAKARSSPVTTKALKPPTTGVKYKKWSAAEMAEQDILIREFFRMQCEECDTKFNVLRDAVTHYRIEHDQPGYIKCCEKKFFKRTMVIDHIKHHTDPNAFQCPRCSRPYISQKALTLHMYTHEEQLLMPYKCGVCNAGFAKRFQLTQHQRMKHMVPTEKSFGCDICGKYYFAKYQIAAHIKSVHVSTHICDICAHTFKNKGLLDMHYRRVHIGETKPKVQCTMCGAWLADERSLRMHAARHSQIQVACTLCGKMTTNKHALANHMRYVHSERLFPCTICDKSFKRAVGLREHLAAHTGVDLYTCTYCPRTFKSNSNMFAHRKKTHPLEWSRDRELRNQL